MNTNDLKTDSVLYITQTQPTDVLLGRGSTLLRHQGNIEFRRLIKSRLPDYIDTLQSGHTKDEIAQEIFNSIVAKNGRFLRVVKDLDEMNTLHIPTSIAAIVWVPVTKGVAIEKIKQAFRDCHKFFDLPSQGHDAKLPAGLSSITQSAKTTSKKTARMSLIHTISSSSKKPRGVLPLSASRTDDYSLESLVAETLRRYQEQQEWEGRRQRNVEPVMRGESPSTRMVSSNTDINPATDTIVKISATRAIRSSLAQMDTTNVTKQCNARQSTVSSETSESLNIIDRCNQQSGDTLSAASNLSLPENVSNNAATIPPSAWQSQLHQLNLSLSESNQVVNSQYFNAASTLLQHHTIPTLPSLTSRENNNPLPTHFSPAQIPPSRQQLPVGLPTVDTLTGSDYLILLQNLSREQSTISTLQHQQFPPPNQQSLSQISTTEDVELLRQLLHLNQNTASTLEQNIQSSLPIMNMTTTLQQQLFLMLTGSDQQQRPFRHTLPAQQQSDHSKPDEASAM